jgi:hypothetical protein
LCPARGLVYGIEPSDTGTITREPALVVVIALGGELVPASRATRVDPFQALRAE